MMTFNAPPKGALYGSHSAMAGGGFMAESSSQSNASPAKGKGASLNQTIRPVTIKQLLGATQSHPDGPFMVDNSELSQFSIIACVRHVREQNNGIDYLLDDGTGCIMGRCWSDRVVANIKEGSWIKCFAIMRSFQNSRTLNLNHTRLVEDCDEITYHCLNAAFCHLQATKSTAAAAGHAQQSTETSLLDDKMLTPIQRAVLGVYAASAAQEGVHIMSIVRSFQGKYSEADVRSTVSWLISEGYMYITIDNDHARYLQAD